MLQRHRVQPDSFEKTLMLGKTEGKRRGGRGFQDWVVIVLGHLMRTVESLEKTLMLGKTEGRRRRRHQRMRWLDSITDSMDMEWIAISSSRGSS